MLSALAQPSTDERRMMIHRAIGAHSYFYKAFFPVVQGIDNTPQYSQKIGINRDFFLTDVQANFNEVYATAGTLYNAQISTNYRRSLFRIDGKLPSAFQSYDSRRDAVTNIFTDVQFEIKPFAIERGDKILAEVQNLATKGADVDLYMVFKGFALVSNPFVPSREVEQINNSLALPATTDYFSFTVEAGTLKRDYIVTNDSRPRLVLGFCVQDLQSPTSTAPVLVSIEDLSRQLTLTDSAIPLECIAPRVRSSEDQTVYYLPIEHYLPPLGKLSFSIEQLLGRGRVGGFRFSVLTRTV